MARTAKIVLKIRNYWRYVFRTLVFNFVCGRWVYRIFRCLRNIVQAYCPIEYFSVSFKYAQCTKYTVFNPIWQHTVLSLSVCCFANFEQSNLLKYEFINSKFNCNIFNSLEIYKWLFTVKDYTQTAFACSKLTIETL